MKDNEIKICGLAAVRARFQRDAPSIVRLYFDHPTSKKVGLMCRALAAARKVYRCVEPSELEKIADSMHHGGIVAVVRGPPPRTPDAGQTPRIWFRGTRTWSSSTGSATPTTSGAIARTAAYFGVPRMVIAGDPASAQARRRGLPGRRGRPRSARDLDRSRDRALSCARCRPRATTSWGPPPGGAPETALARHTGPWALVLGNEEHGLAADVEAACTRLVTIAGSGRVESLNVSAAAAILIHELGRPGARRQHRAR
jgi:TrmH RNA methyltransferase